MLPPASAATVVTDQELDELIGTFARGDSPQDPIARSIPGEGSPAALGVESDEDLHAAAVRFSNQMNRLASATSPDPWATFRSVTDVVTPADLRCTPSLRTIGSLRPQTERVISALG